SATADECPGPHSNRLHLVGHQSRDGALSAITSSVETHMSRRKPRVSGAYLLLLASLSPRASRADSRSIGAEHDLAGEVRALDDAAKTVVVHTADDADETATFSEDTT